MHQRYLRWHRKETIPEALNCSIISKSYMFYTDIKTKTHYQYISHSVQNLKWVFKKWCISSFRRLKIQKSKISKNRLQRDLKKFNSILIINIVLLNQLVLWNENTSKFLYFMYVRQWQKITVSKPLISKV